MPTLLITGGNGQLGQELKTLAGDYPQWTFLCPTKEELNITDSDELNAFFERYRPNYCLNTAAYTAVDKAEEAVDVAFAVNSTAAQLLATICSTYQTRLIHYSTDYVYQGNVNRPLCEGDPTNGGGVYAASKLKGDEAVMETMPSAIVLRTSWVYSSFGHNFVKTMLRFGRERDALRVVFDQVGSPTYARDLAKVSLVIVSQYEDENDSNPPGGIYHYSNEGVCSWYDFALAIFEIVGISCEVTPIESVEYPTPAQRPHYSVLNKSKIKKELGITIPHWRDSLQECLNVLT